MAAERLRLKVYTLTDLLTQTVYRDLATPAVQTLLQTPIDTITRVTLCLPVMQMVWRGAGQVAAAFLWLPSDPDKVRRVSKSPHGFFYMDGPEQRDMSPKA